MVALMESRWTQQTAYTFVAALESMPTSTASQRQLQHQLNRRVMSQSQARPENLNSPTRIDIGDCVDAYANAPNKVCASPTTSAAETTFAPYSYAQCNKTCEFLRSAPDAALVLRVPATLCSASPCTHSAQLDVPPLAPMTRDPIAAAKASVGPETLATSQTTCRTVCSLVALDMESGTVMEKQFLADYQRCCSPPPLFVLLVSLLEITVFVYDYIAVQLPSAAGAASARGATREFTTNKLFVPSESLLIYRPDRRLEMWRFVSYMVLHANWFHLSFNVGVQLVYGLPLELVHGSARVAAIYLAGVFAGSLGTSVVDSEVYLVGASGGVYALLAAHLANILLNFGQMRCGIVQLVRLIVFVSCDLGYAFCSKYYSTKAAHSAAKALPSVSYIAHLTGALAGLTMGLLVLKNFGNSKAAHSKLLWWLAFGLYSAFMIFAITFNLSWHLGSIRLL